MYYSIESLTFSQIDNVSIKSGYILFNPNNWGGCYEQGNVIYDFHQLNSKGTIIGSPTLENIDVIYNYPNCLIPGFFPQVSGRWEIDQEYYNLENVLNEPIITKVLGTGLGNLNTWKVSSVSRSGVGADCFTTDLRRDRLGNLFEDDFINVIRFPNFSNLLKGYVSPLSELGPGEYMEFFNWDSQFGIDFINGTNTFPFYGWGGIRLGDIIPQNFQYLQDSTYSYPSFFLNFSKGYTPEGIIYPGQLVQFNTSEANSEVKSLGILPYQEGRGIFDYMSRDVLYNRFDGQIDLVSVSYNIPSEGAVAGRNTTHGGMAISKTWSNKLNLNNIVAGSTTPQEKSNNAPLCYIPQSEADNSNNTIPWSPLLSSRENCDILTQGITTGIISGAYPIYRGGWSSRWSGSSFFTINNGIVMYDQYYTTDEFWDPNNKDQSTPQVSDQDFPVKPNPPYGIKGGIIVLFEGQRVKAGSYVYSTMALTGNVTIPQFIPPGAKQLILNKGESNNILPDTYAKNQGNQGGLIVMVSNDNSPPPNPPSNCVPVGVVLEDIIGYGTPESFEDNIQNNIDYEFILNDRDPSDVGDNITQARINPENVKQIQAREILFRLFPMTPNLSSTGYSSYSILVTEYLVFPNALTISYGNFNLINSFTPELNLPSFQPLYQRCRTDYYLPVGKGGYNIFREILGSFTSLFKPGWGWREKQSRNDTPNFT